ncbi:hypothetical protein [Arthrobacter sp. UYEF3]|uniref:hypothetical protein n=1 Tax=Arthrobacter sp. UYEF3 TaxID=1756365 RepID=UPI003391D770
MTQPAMPVPVDQHDGGPWRAAAARPARWKGPVAIAAAGLPAGLLWWLLAPTGLNLITRDPALAAGSNPGTWLPRDLVLAGLFLLAGCLSGVLTAGNRPARLTTATVVLAVAAGAAGALLAWGTGVLAGSWWGPAAEIPGSAGTAFSLRAYAMLLIWPAATALAIFLATVVSRPEPGQGGAPDA